MYTYRWSQKHLFLKLYILNIALAEYIMRNAGLDEVQAGIKIARRNTNNLTYADDSNLMGWAKQLDH